MSSRPLRHTEDAASPNVIRAMRERIDLLEEQVRQYREGIEQRPVPFPKDWGLSRFEGRILLALLDADGRFLSGYALMVAAHGDEHFDFAPKAAHVFIHRLRKKVCRRGVVIIATRGVGYALNTDSVIRLRHALDAQTGAGRQEQDRAERAALQARIAELSAQNDRLRSGMRPAQTRIHALEEEIHQLRELLAPSIHFPIAWRLSAQQSALLSALYARVAGTSHDALRAAVFGLDVEMCESALSVVVYDARRRLRPHGIRIEKIQGFGLTLPPESRAAIDHALASVAAGEAA